MRLHHRIEISIIFSIVCAFPVYAQDGSCLDVLMKKASERDLVRQLDVLTCVKSLLKANDLATRSIAKAEAQTFLDSYRSDFEEVARKNIVYLGKISSCKKKTIPVPSIDGTTTDNWHVLTSKESYSAHFGSGEMRNNAIYSVSYSFEPSGDKKSWIGYMSLQVNAATEQKRETTSTCASGSNKNGSNSDLFAIRKY